MLRKQLRLLIFSTTLSIQCLDNTAIFHDCYLAFQVLVGSCFQSLLHLPISGPTRRNFEFFFDFLDTHRISTKHLDLCAICQATTAPVLPQVLLLYFRHGPGDGRAIEVALAQLLRLYEGQEVEMCKSHMNYSETQRKTWEDHGGVIRCGYPWNVLQKRMNSGVMDVSDSGSFWIPFWL